ncbi:MAG: phytanoyl-CoA dioxygenase family protein [Gammaproteobacteria bacterium]|nr:phytanoyl-CoA dioxygenase family protein [Gammaproteobacteria bacterium]MCY4324045.1 phytanoyl-CoA dioxygenase family protein [Gammaproteobacteria bacterium]
MNWDIEAHARRIEDQGYSVADSVMSEALMARIRSDLDPHFEASPNGRNDFEGFATQRLYALPDKSASSAELIEHPLVLGLTDRFLRHDYRLSAAIAIKVHGGETPQDFHRDDNPAGAPDTGVRDMWGFSTMWMLDDFTESNGATEVIPGSHAWPVERVADASQAVKVCAPAGSVLLFAGNLIHRGGRSRETDRGVRLGITIQYAQPWLRTIENFSLSAPPEKAARFSDRMQALLGYSVAAPGFVGYVDGVHPKRLIDSQYQGRKHHGTPSLGWW